MAPGGYDRAMQAPRRPPTAARLVASVILAVLVAGCVTSPSATPRLDPTQLTGGETTRPIATADTGGTDPPSSAPAESPIATPPPGAMEASTLDLSATYAVNAAIDVRSGDLDVSTVIQVANVSGGAIDHLQLNTIAARLGGLRIVEATVEEVPVQVRIDDQTLFVPLGRELEAGDTTSIRIGYRATLQEGTAGSDWMFTRSNGTIALYRWIPWVSRAVPFSRPNHGDPFVTVTSPLVDVELITDRPMILAAPSAHVQEFAAGAGSAWAFTVENVRDVSIVLAPDFNVTRGEANNVPVRVYTRPGGLSGSRLAAEAERAIRSEAEQLRVNYPWEILTVVETEGGFALESPGLIWLPDDTDTLNLVYLIHHEVAHQWFYGLVGNDQRNEPFADEATADMLARSVLGNFRSTRCARADLDRPITAYSESCYYEVVYVQGGLLLEEIRGEMGSGRFWDAVRAYIEEHRLGLGGTRQLLDALVEGSEADLGPILRSRFPDLF